MVYISLKEFGVVGSDTYTWSIKDFHKCWLGSLAKRRLCLGPAGVINCTPLSALSFWMSLFPGTRGYKKTTFFLNMLQENGAQEDGLVLGLGMGHQVKVLGFVQERI